GAGAARRRSRSHAGCRRGARTGGIAGDLSRRRAGAPRAGAAGASADRGAAPEPASGRRRHGRSPGRGDGQGKQRRRDRDPAGERHHPGGAGLRLDRVGLRRHSRARRGPGEGGGRMSATNTAMLLSDWTSPLYGWLMSLGAIGVIIWIVLKVLVIMMPVIIAVAFYVVWERKLSGWMHARHGPMYVGWGVLQAFADVFKLLFKEVIQPTNAQKTLYILAPLITLAPAFAAWAVVPFDAQLVLSDANAGLLYLLAMTSLGVYGVILAGWASNSRYAFLGAMRSAAQVVSYEIAMGFALVGVMVGAGSLNLSQIVMAQSGNAG